MNRRASVNVIPRCILEFVIEKKVQVGNEKEKAQSERSSTPKTEVGKNLNWQLGTYT